MFSFICGKVVDSTAGQVVVQCNDIGYELNVSLYTQSKCVVGEQIQLFCHLQVREDGIQLYGFSSRQEKLMFLRLISVSGVGCKMAQQILSGSTPDELAMSIFNGDTKKLTKIKGLGKKTAERLILELKEKIMLTSEETVMTPIEQFQQEQLDNEMQNAVAILESLGLHKENAVERVKLAKEKGANTVEELLNAVFRS